jgi:hypothetical protein
MCAGNLEEERSTLDRYNECNKDIKYLKYELICETMNIISCLLECVAVQSADHYRRFTQELEAIHQTTRYHILDHSNLLKKHI